MDQVSDQNPDMSVSDEHDVENNDEQSKEDKVKYDTFQRVLRQKKALEEKMSAYEKQLNEIKMREEAEKEESLRKQQKFEELSKELEAKLEKERKEKEEYQRNLLDTHKLQKVLEKLPGRPKRSEYLSFIDLDRVEIDASTGEVVEDSVSEVANDFLTNHGFLIETKGRDLPNDAPKNTKKLTFEQWKSLPLKERKLRMNEVVDSE